MATARSLDRKGAHVPLWFCNSGNVWTERLSSMVPYAASGGAAVHKKSINAVVDYLNQATAVVRSQGRLFVSLGPHQHRATLATIVSPSRWHSTTAASRNAPSGMCHILNNTPAPANVGSVLGAHEHGADGAGPEERDGRGRPRELGHALPARRGRVRSSIVVARLCPPCLLKLLCPRCRRMDVLL